MEFLRSTRYCDVDHSAINDAASRIADGARSEVDVAVRLFRFVRDHVRYTFGPWGQRASATLGNCTGVCTNKSNLLVALLRAAGIPSAYGILRVNAQQYFGNIAPPYLTPLISPRSVHVYAAALLHGRWIRCDPSTDGELSRKTAHFCRQTRLVEWDGRQDALDWLQPEHVHEDLGIRPDIDDLLDRPPRRAQPETLASFNRYLEFIRTRPPFRTAEDLIEAYWTHFTTEAHPASA